MLTLGRSNVGQWDSEPHALLIEDELAIVTAVREAFEQGGIKVSVARNGMEGIERFRGLRPDVVMLDLTLPGMSGFDVCRRIREESTVPILIVTARDTEADRVLGLEIGADDYLTKPFSMRELLSRVRSHLRRAGMEGSHQSARLSSGPVRLDVERHEVWVRDVMVDFPPKEFKLLETLMRAQGRVRTRASLIDEVWDPHYVGDTKTLDVHMRRLRQKIELDPHNPEYILTVRGIGYRFVGEGRPARPRALPSGEPRTTLPGPRLASTSMSAGALALD